VKVLVVIPVFNEQVQLAKSVTTVQCFLRASSKFDYQITIAENGSTDRTPQIADELANSLTGVNAVHLPQKGRGRALRSVWSKATADIFSYMDVDLSTDLSAFPYLIEAVSTGRFDLAIGTRLHQNAHTHRSWRREVISRTYNRLVKWMFEPRFSDAQCGFKAISLRTARKLLPLIKDEEWFFDTELLLVAEKLGCRICEIPVKWLEDPDSRVKIIPTVWGQLKGLVRVRRKMKRGELTKLKDTREAKLRGGKKGR
jgi:glycosyltransferase involved in cell wall biosynthesis